jgi:hypothetical protein
MTFKTISSVLAVAVALIASGCAPRAMLSVPGPRGTGAGADMAIRELAVRHMLALPRDGMDVYVSFGASWSDKVDPPKTFFERLQDVGDAVHPVSELDEQPQEKAVLLVVSQPFWQSDQSATVSAVRFRFGVGGADGLSARAKWADGVWTLAATTNWGT